MPQTASGLTFFEEEFETGVIMGLAQETDGFNAASRNTIVLDTGADKGLLPKRTLLQALSTSALIQTRDPQGTGTLVPVVPQDTTQGSVKVFHGAPIIWRRQDWEDTGLGTETGTRYAGVNMAMALAERWLNAGIAALTGAIGSIGATAQVIAPSPATFDYGLLNQGKGKMGDRMQTLAMTVGHSKAFTDLMGQAFTSQQVAFQLGNSAITTGSLGAPLGLPMLVTDAPPLVNATRFSTLLLVPGAVTVSRGPTSRVFSFITGDGATTPENQTWLLTEEGSFEIKVAGVSWTGAAKPSDADLANAANWTAIGQESTVKQGPGIEIETD